MRESSASHPVNTHLNFMLWSPTGEDDGLVVVEVESVGELI